MTAGVKTVIPKGHAKGMTGPLPYFHVDDIEAADGNAIGLLQDG